MKRIGEFSGVQADTWLALMQRAFPDVAPGDRLAGVHDGRGGVRFYFNGQQMAEIHDMAFAQLFFGIWLSVRSSAPRLRAALLGQASCP